MYEFPLKCFVTIERCAIDPKLPQTFENLRMLEKEIFYYCSSLLYLHVMIWRVCHYVFRFTHLYTTDQIEFASYVHAPFWQLTQYSCMLTLAKYYLSKNQLTLHMQMWVCACRRLLLYKCRFNTVFSFISCS